MNLFDYLVKGGIVSDEKNITQKWYDTYCCTAYYRWIRIPFL